MRLWKVVFVLSLAAVMLTGCARPPSRGEVQSALATRDVTVTGSVGRPAPIKVSQRMPDRVFHRPVLAGRLIEVGQTSDIRLERGEVVLTFDDGPRPGKTPAILDTLDAFGVKAMFLMLGRAARAHPELAQQVALRGHTVGSHTYDHADLATLSRQAALAEIVRGEEAVAKALDGAGSGLSPFFRFPYLSQTGFLRTNLVQGSMVVLDVDIDSKDYFDSTPEQVVERTLAALEARGSGVILFHDIHARTVALLPDFLAALEAKGYHVVHLVPRDPEPFGRDVITAQSSSSSSTSVR